jgi:hypothetical protein
MPWDRHSVIVVHFGPSLQLCQSGQQSENSKWVDLDHCDCIALGLDTIADCDPWCPGSAQDCNVQPARRVGTQKDRDAEGRHTRYA